MKKIILFLIIFFGFINFSSAGYYPITDELDYYLDENGVIHGSTGNGKCYLNYSGLSFTIGMSGSFSESYECNYCTLRDKIYNNLYYYKDGNYYNVSTLNSYCDGDLYLYDYYNCGYDEMVMGYSEVGNALHCSNWNSSYLENPISVNNFYYYVEESTCTYDLLDKYYIVNTHDGDSLYCKPGQDYKQGECSSISSSQSNITYLTTLIPDGFTVNFYSHQSETNCDNDEFIYGFQGNYSKIFTYNPFPVSCDLDNIQQWFNNGNGPSFSGIDYSNYYGDYISSWINVYNSSNTDYGSNINTYSDFLSYIGSLNMTESTLSWQPMFDYCYAYTDTYYYNGIEFFQNGFYSLTSPITSSDGEDGEDGFNCWDLNQNHINDSNEDINGDGYFNTLDCQGEDGQDGIDGEDGQDCEYLGSYQNESLDGYCYRYSCDGGTTTQSVCDGADGLNGEDGESCTLSGSIINCGDNSFDLSDLSGTDGIDGEDGYNCWDLDQDHINDSNEDTNGDGYFNTLDCQGEDGQDGTNGVDGIDGEDGIDGQDGEDGYNCWDLDQDHINDLNEDINGDGYFNTLDCSGEDGSTTLNLSDDTKDYLNDLYYGQEFSYTGNIFDSGTGGINTEAFDGFDVSGSGAIRFTPGTGLNDIVFGDLGDKSCKMFGDNLQFLYYSNGSTAINFSFGDYDNFFVDTISFIGEKTVGVFLAPINSAFQLIMIITPFGEENKDYCLLGNIVTYKSHNMFKGTEYYQKMTLIDYLVLFGYGVFLLGLIFSFHNIINPFSGSEAYVEEKGIYTKSGKQKKYTQIITSVKRRKVKNPDNFDVI